MNTLRITVFCCLLLLCSVLVSSQNADDPSGHGPGSALSGNVRFPSGKLQRDEIVKQEYQKSLQDADELIKISGELKEELIKGNGQVVSLTLFKQLDTVDKLSKRIRVRLKRY